MAGCSERYETRQRGEPKNWLPSSRPPAIHRDKQQCRHDDITARSIGTREGPRAWLAAANVTRRGSEGGRRTGSLPPVLLLSGAPNGNAVSTTSPLARSARGKALDRGWLQRTLRDAGARGAEELAPFLPSSCYPARQTATPPRRHHRSLDRHAERPSIVAGCSERYETRERGRPKNGLPSSRPPAIHRDKEQRRHDATSVLSIRITVRRLTEETTAMSQSPDYRSNSLAVLIC